MTSKVTVEAQSHACEVRLMPRLKSGELWDSLSDETKRTEEIAFVRGDATDLFGEAA